MSVDDLEELCSSAMKGDVGRALELTQRVLDAGIPAKEIMDKGLVRAMNIVGDGFARSEIFFPELLMAGAAITACLQPLKQEFLKGRISYVGKYVIGTVQGDVHDIGKNIVIMMLEGNGWEVTDLGIDVPPEKFCEAVKEGNYDIVGIGAYLSMTLPKMAETIEALKETGLKDRVKVMVGGVPVTQGYADKIGADAYGDTAVTAVIKARSLIGK